jgi:hypothetical protein
VSKCRHPFFDTKTITQRLVATHGKDYEKRAALRDLIREVRTI